MRLTAAFIDRIFDEITTYQSQSVGEGVGKQGKNSGTRKVRGGGRFLGNGDGHLIARPRR